MSDEEKKSSTTGAPQAPVIDDSVTAVKKAKHWPIVISVFAVLAIAVLVAFLHWHEMPSFCSTFCHATMDRYVQGYYSGDESMEAAVHEEKGVTCLGCHWPQAKMMDLVHEVVLYVSDGFTDPLEDQTSFASDEFCGKCHDGVTAPTKESATEDWAINPHNIPDVAAHQTAGADGGAIQCSDCHKAHKASTFACAKCHDGMAEVPEGWKTPDVSVNVMANHSTAVSSDKCVECHNDVTAPSKETASADYTWNGEPFDFHNMSDDLKSAHEGFVPDFSCETCHANNSVAACTACHADAFTEDNLPAGWTLTDDSSDSAATEAASSSSDSAAASAGELADGTYTGEAKGMESTIKVEVTVEGGKITALTADGQETEGIGSKALEQLPAKIVEANGTDGVDAVSGASVTSKAIFDATNAALASAGAGDGAAAASSASDKAASSASEGAASYKDGEYTGEAKGMESTIQVTVTVKDGKITDVKADGQETEGIGSKALEQLPAKIVEANGTDGVDAVSGASVTSKAIFSAVDTALESAK